VLRVFLGIVMFPHGAQKVLGWIGGGFRGVASISQRQTEFLGPIALAPKARNRIA
jgi:uncharacterized membrane protein YphA (DoxX/SURF4 family)